MASEKLRIYSDRRLVPPDKPHAVMLYPFWGKNPEEPLDPLHGRYDQYRDNGRVLFDMMPSLGEAELVIAPLDWEDSDSGKLAIRQLSKEARSLDKPIIIFFWADSSAPIPIENAIVFRTSLYRSRQKHNEFAMPSWSEDFTEKYTHGEIVARQKQSKPVIGFCGYVQRQRSWLRILKGSIRAGRNPSRVLDLYRSHSAHYTRSQALSILSKSSDVGTNFLIRKQFFAGSLAIDPDKSLSRKINSRHEYVRNMIESDYVLCIRGAGNFSYRLYETLSSGRIPIFVDTDCVLPYDFVCNWKNYCVWVDGSEVRLSPTG